MENKNPLDNNEFTPAMLALQNGHGEIAGLIQMAFLQNETLLSEQNHSPSTEQNMSPKENIEIISDQGQSNEGPPSKKLNSRWS